MDQNPEIPLKETPEKTTEKREMEQGEASSTNAKPMAAQVTDVEKPSSNELAPTPTPTPTLPILPLIAPPSPVLPAPMPPPISLCDPNILVRSPRNPNEFVSVMSLMFPQQPPATIPPVQPPPPRMPTVPPFYSLKMPPPTCLHDPNILVRSTLNWFEFELLPPLSPSPKEDSPPLQEDPPPEEDSPLLHEDPESKSQNQSLLIPEDRFLAQHPGPVDIFLSVSNVDEVNPKDEPLKITVSSLSENVLSVKDKIASDIQLPAKKLKLFGKFGFLKNDMSLAYYNVGPGEKLALSLRQRGGRKR